MAVFVVLNPPPPLYLESQLTDFQNLIENPSHLIWLIWSHLIDFIDLGVIDDVTSQVKGGIFDRSQALRKGVLSTSQSILSKIIDIEMFAETVCCKIVSLKPGQVTEVRSQKGTISPIPYQGRVIHFYGLFFISNSMVRVIWQKGSAKVTLWSMSGQGQVKKGQISKLIFCKEGCPFDAVCHGEFNGGLSFRTANNQVWKFDVINFE